MRAEMCRCNHEGGSLWCNQESCWCHDVVPKNVLLLPKDIDGVHRAAWSPLGDGSGGRLFETPKPRTPRRPIFGFDPGSPGAYVRGHIQDDGRITIDTVI